VVAPTVVFGTLTTVHALVDELLSVEVVPELPDVSIVQRRASGLVHASIGTPSHE